MLLLCTMSPLCILLKIKLLLANNLYFSESEYLTREARLFKLLRERIVKQGIKNNQLDMLNNLFKCTGSIIKVLFIKILIEQVQEQRNFI